MSLNEHSVEATANDWLWRRVRLLENAVDQLQAELARFEQVAVATATTPHTLKVHRADGTCDWVDNGTTLWIKNEATA